MFIRRTAASYPYEWLDRLSTYLLLFTLGILPLVILPATRDSIDFPKSLILTVVVLCSFVLWLLRGILSRELYIRSSSLDIPVFIFFGSAAISTIFSVSPEKSLFGDVRHFVLHLAAIVSFILWAWLLLQYIRSTRLWRTFIHTLLGGCTIAGWFFLLRSVSFLPFLSIIPSWNTSSASQSIFGSVMAVVGVLGIGMTLDRHRSIERSIIPLVASLTSIVVLLRLGFTVSWVIGALGFGLLLTLGMTILVDLRQWLFHSLFVLFVLVMCFVFLGSPQIVRVALPGEVILGIRASFDLAKDAVIESGRSSLFGHGPGTFSYIFSKFHSSDFNTTDIAVMRFFVPYSTAIALLGEFGLVGLLSFFFIILFLGSACLGAWKRRHQDVSQPIHFLDDAPPRHIETMTVVVAWVITTGILFASFGGVVVWFLWWTLLILSFIGVYPYLKNALREHTILLDVSAQYSLVLSFGVMVVVSAILFVGTSLARRYVGEVAYTRATRTGNMTEETEYVRMALGLRPREPEYLLSLATIYFEEAKRIADSTEASSDVVATLLSDAVSLGRKAATIDPKNVETWDTLSLLYSNTRGLAPEANEWTRDALEHALRAEPNSAVFHWRLGLVLSMLGEYEAAETHLRQAILLNPDYTTAYLSLSELLEVAGRVDDAILVFQPIASQIENDPGILFHVGRLLYNRGGQDDIVRAKAAWERAVQLSPDFSNALYSLGLLSEQEGGRKTALEYYQKVLRLNPDNGDVKKKIQTLRGS